MNRKSLLLLFLFLFLVACGTDNPALPRPQDSFDEVTLTPLPTHTPLPTDAPITEDASGIARAFYRAWENSDYLGMYSLLSPQSQALVGSQAFVERYETVMTTAAVLSLSAQPLAIIQEGGTAQFDVRLTWQTAVVGDFSRDYTVPLVYDNGRWGVVWDEGLILPELAGGHRLEFTYRIPARANIYDIEGLALAYQGNIISLGVVPGDIVDEEGLLAVLSEVFNRSPDVIKESYAAAQPDWYWPLGDIPEDRFQEYFPQLQPYIDAGLAPPSSRLSRIYTQQGIAPHIVGHTGYIPAEEVDAYKALGYRGDEAVGQSGLELWGETYLNGERGGSLDVVGSSGEYISTIQAKEPKQARAIYTTLHREFQAEVEQLLAEAIESYAGASAGSIVIMDVDTGAIRALASYPTFNPAIFDAVRPDAAAALGRVLSDPGRPLVNRATQGAYPAGSVFKIMTMSAALNSGIYSPGTLYYSTGSWDRLGENFVKYDWREGGHGNVSLRTALVVSCNSCFYDVGYNLYQQGMADLLPDTARQFGLGAPTGIQIAEASGLIPDDDWKLATYGEGWSPGDSVNMSIGQGFVQVTPLQIATMMAAVANGGSLVTPTLVDRIGSGGGAPEESWPHQTHGQLPLSAEQLDVIRGALLDVANDENRGTAAHRFVGLPVTVAGKTGTAEDPPRNSHAWFAGYAPAAPYTLADGTVVDTPQIAIVVMIENAGEGSAVAAPVFRRAVEAYYDITPVAPYPWQ